MKGLKIMENQNTHNGLYDTYTPIKLSEGIYNGLRKLLCDYGINGTVDTPSPISKPEQNVFNDIALMAEILLKKLKREYKHHE